MSKPKAPPFDELRRLLDFVEEYAAQHPEFAEALAGALTPTPSRKSRPQALLDPFEVARDGGEEGLTAYLASLGDADVLKVGKTLGLRLVRKDGRERHVERILERVRKERQRGLSFTR